MKAALPPRLSPARYRELLAMARRQSRGGVEAGDLLNEALAAALAVGRPLSAIGEAWLAGVMRNLARMQARGAVRRRGRERQYADLADRQSDPVPRSMPSLDGLPNSARLVALLALSGHGRAEIRYLLRISDEALRQRIAVVRRHFGRSPGEAPDDFLALSGPLAFGVIRRGLLPLTRSGTAFLASHDPDGHPIAFAISSRAGSRIAGPRQPVIASNPME